jgi:hypothetical protein
VGSKLLSDPGLLRGFRDARTGHLLYNFGSFDGGVGAIWSARQAFFVAGGMRYARAIPEIYNCAMARQWAELAHIARHRYHARSSSPAC